MPRFEDSSIACLKRVMLTRAPHGFMFAPQDVQAVVQETGLNQAQVQVWAEHFRMRYTTEKERLDFLQADALDKSVRDHPPSLGQRLFSGPSLTGWSRDHLPSLELKIFSTPSVFPDIFLLFFPDQIRQNDKMFRVLFQHHARIFQRVCVPQVQRRRRVWHQVHGGCLQQGG
jgi:hypothetical protein